jgi:tetratricopeptide (TPR) repeat protein/transcriptional regulator with XRE-family HTH domain
MLGEEVERAETFGAELRRTRRSRSVSLRDLGLLVHYSKGHLSKIENNIAPASLDLAEACDSALRADGRLTAAFLADFSRLVPVSGTAEPNVPFDIPPPPSHFAGRDAETARVIEAIFAAKEPCRAPVVLIHGRPGIGKTALAAQAAHTARTRYPDGCLFVDFGSVADGAPPHARLLRRLGVSPEDIPAGPDEARAAYLSVLYRRHVLIVADNVTSSAQVTGLVPASPECAVIATSRSRLDALDDCLPIPLSPLRPADAAMLFRAVSGLQELAREEDLLRIVAACDHVPLAVRVAAAKARESGHDAAELAELLEDPATAWPELDDGERSVLRTLREEYGALPDGGQRTLTMLALHPGQTAAQQQVAWLTGGSPHAVAADLGVLRQHDLVAVGPDRRVFAHGLVRRLAVTLADQLDEGARAESMRRLVAGYTRTAAAADTMITPSRYQPPGGGDEETTSFGDSAAAIAWCQAEAALLPRLCSLALEFDCYGDCWRLAYAMRDYFFRIRAFAPWVSSHRVALLAAERSGNAWAQAITRNNLGMAYAEQGGIEAAQAQYRQALELMRKVGDSQGVATTLGHQAWASHAAGQQEVAISLAVQANEVNRRHGNRRSLAIMDRTIALAYSRNGQYRESLGHLAECREILAELDLPLDVAMTFNCMGEVYCAMGQFAKAGTYHALAAEQSIACGGIGEQARAIKGQAAAACAAGEGERAKDLYQQAASLFATFGLATA